MSESANYNYSGISIQNIFVMLYDRILIIRLAERSKERLANEQADDSVSDRLKRRSTE